MQRIYKAILFLGKEFVLLIMRMIKSPYMYYGLLAILSFFVIKNVDFTDKNNAELPQETQKIYQYKVTDLQGNEFDFNTLKGKKIIVVNTASKCGLTPQYEGLQKLYETYEKDGVVVVGFPSNDFLWQEPGTSEEISSFCKENYGVTFPMMQKIKVKGSDKNDVYSFLTEKNKNGLEDSKVKWNFQKYLINREGELER